MLRTQFVVPLLATLVASTLAFITAGQQEPEAPKPEFRLQELPAQRVILRDVVGSYDLHGQVITDLYGYMMEQGIVPTGGVLGIYLDDPAEVAADQLRWQVGVPVGDEEEVTAEDPYHIEVLPACGAVVYEAIMADLDQVDEAAREWMTDKGLQKTAPTRMMYIGMNPDPTRMRTRVMVPVGRAGHKTLDQATLEDLSFMAGNWQGTMSGHDLFEQWSEPAGEAMVGSFIWLKADGSVRLYELMTIRTTEQGMTFMLRHFGADFKPREDADSPLEARLVNIRPGHAAFEFVDPEERLLQIVFHARDDGGLNIILLPREGGEAAATTFKFDRVSDDG